MTKLANLVLEPKKLDKEVWNPLKSYQCFCCHDTGYVIKVWKCLDYHPFSRPIACRRLGCPATPQTSDKIVDTRVTPEDCQQLHEEAIEEWKKTRLDWHQQRQALAAQTKDCIRSAL